MKVQFQSVASEDLVKRIQTLVGVPSDGKYGKGSHAAVVSRLLMTAGSTMEDIQRRLGLAANDNIMGNATAKEIIEELAPHSPFAPEVKPGKDPVALISVPYLKLLAPAETTDWLTQWVVPLQKACVRYNINTTRRVAAFLAQLAHESGFKLRKENLNYSQAGLRSTFGAHRITDAECKQLGRPNNTKTPLTEAQQRAVANVIYGGPWGLKNLGNKEPNDGWDFRGVGPLQGTGRSNMTKFAKSMGMTLLAATEYARTLEGGVLYAGWFWEENKVNQLADTEGVADETKKINGGDNGLADRAAKTELGLKHLRAQGAH